MDIEELSKSQIVLLVLLISFVTSMATGIVTVSLMDSAPTSVAQTVNKVIQQTIREVSTPVQSQSASVGVTKTVVVKQSDEVASAVQQATPSVVRLYSADGTTFLGLGVVIDKLGSIVTDAAAIGDAANATIPLPNSTSVTASVTTRDAGAGLAFLSVATSSVSTSTPAWVPISLAPAQAVLGETVILLSGQKNPWVESGLVSSLVPDGGSNQALVKTDILGDNVLYGSPLVDTGGSLVGISTAVSRSSSGSSFEPVAAIRADLTQANSSK